jgi:hypothetical protein
MKENYEFLFIQRTLSTPFEIHWLMSMDEITLSNKVKKLRYGLLNVGYKFSN